MPASAGLKRRCPGCHQSAVARSHDSRRIRRQNLHGHLTLRYDLVDQRSKVLAGQGEHELRVGVAANVDASCFTHDREHPPNLRRPASGNQRDRVTTRFQTQFTPEKIPVGSFRDVPHHRMPYKVGSHTRIPVKLLLKGEDGHHAVHPGRDLTYSSASPCPDLRADVVAYGNSCAARDFAKPQVHIGKINRDKNRVPSDFATRFSSSCTRRGCCEPCRDLH